MTGTISHMTNDIVEAVREFLDIADVKQWELAEATHRHEMSLNKALNNKSGQVPPMWQDIFKACGLKVVVVPEAYDIDPLALVRQHALSMRNTDKKLHEVQGDE